MKNKKIEEPKEQKIYKLPRSGVIGKAKIAVVCEPPNAMLWENGLPIGGGGAKLFAKIAQECGFKKDDFYFVSACPPIPEAIEASDKKISEFVAPYREQVLRVISKVEPKLIIYLGKWAGRQTMGKAVKITKARGSFVTTDIPGKADVPVLPMLSPNHVITRPENTDIFKSDFGMARMLDKAKYNVKKIKSLQADKEYTWCTDLTDFMNTNPKLISCDTETTGLKWITAGTDDPKAVKVLTVQIGYAPGKALVVPVDCDYYPELTPNRRKKLIRQLKTLLENPKIRKTGHNFKYDTHVLREDLGIYVDFDCDTQLLAFVADENMQEKSLDECIRRWVPEMAGYNDRYNQKLDKENMRGVSHEDMLMYGGGDADASFRLAMKLTELCKQDEKQFKCYKQIILPAIKAFADPIEFYGIRIDTKALSKLQKELAVVEKEMYDDLISQVPRKIKQKFIDPKKPKDGLSFTRDQFTREILFGKDGLRLKPKVFTKSTAKLENLAERIPSVSTKQHLPYFNDVPFVAQLTEYVKLQKLRSTYVGVPYDEDKGGPTGFWQYIYNNEIHPSFMLHRVVTGRTASSNPNGQNFPKRGKLAKAYRKIFVARPGYVLIETDLSQAELRIAAWMANEKKMLQIYRDGGDIHAHTAAATMNMNVKKFLAMEGDERPARLLGDLPGLDDYLKREGDDATIGGFFDYKRFQAKAIGFGFLYGMGWRKFKAYAKTDYGLDFTDEEAQALREAFFKLYPGLVEWHKRMREKVNKNGFVRALHGALRRLPSINSTEDYIKQECERQAINSPVQRFASDLGLMAMVRLTRDANPDDIRPLMFVHDALVIEVKEELAAQARGWVKFYMESPPLQEWFGLTPPVPIIADIAQGKNLSEMEKFKDAKAVPPPWYSKKKDKNLVVC